MKFHGQFEEDRIAYHYFQRFRPADLRKTYLDVGAFDGAHLSNTLLFEELGWKGICVEANTAVFPELRANRKCICLNVGCSDTEGSGDFYGEEGLTALGTINRQAADVLNATEKWHVSARHTIPMRTVDRILEDNQMPEIDFASIDVDGSELEVLRGFNLRRAKPKLICIETNLGMVGKGRWPRAHSEEIHRIISEAGYFLLMANQCNSFYSFDKLSAAERFVLWLRGFASRISRRLSRPARGRISQ